MKFRYIRHRLTTPAPRILDIGCGNGSPSLTKKWFPACHYSGADIQSYKLSDADIAAVDQFYPIGADGSGYDAIPDTSYDLVILNHVIEHMPNPAPIIAKLCGKLKPGGYMWLAFPSLRSLSLPHSVDETLNFCDDPTHVYLPDVPQIVNVLLRSGVSIVHAGRSREGFLTSVADCFKLAKRLLIRMVTGKFSGRGLWYVLGFEDHVLGRRKLN